MQPFSRIWSRSQKKWIPAAVIAVASSWWLWRAYVANYQTLFHLAVPLLSAGIIAVWFATYGGLRRRARYTTVAVATLAVVTFFVVFRPVYNGDMGVYRWRLRFAKGADFSLQQSAPIGAASDWHPTSHDYPAFLGGGLWAEVKGVDLESDWKKSSPRELWRHEIGGGWSAFSIVGDYAVTQEQRGENELVSCYRVKTGEAVWTHVDKARFDPSDAIGGLGDIGPRATPTIVGDRIFTQGGTGIVNCLEAHHGHVVWAHDTTAEFDVPVTTWGKSGSPLVMDGLVIISVGAPANATDFHSSLVAFDATTGEVRWKAGSRRASYATPVVATLAGEKQIVVVNDSWVTGHRASDGEVLWEHPWSEEHDSSASCSQPIPLEGDRLFLSKGYGVGCSLLAISRGSNGEFAAKTVWEPPIKKVMKTKFSNALLRDGFVYGLDDVLLECLELETGRVKWKKRREPVFGHGQIMLIGNTILVLSETGELALVEANPDEYHELASLQALDSSNVTWNNPAFAPPYLLLRNAREAACYELPLKK
jgi:outer membrane protein assembly factor BamB